MKNNLAFGEVLVMADFSKNYSFVLENSVQGVHWNNAQATKLLCTHSRAIIEKMKELITLHH